jgi:hypothetical protein
MKNEDFIPMDDKTYIRIWRELSYGQKPLKPTKDEIEVLKKDFESIKDVSPKNPESYIELRIGLN